MEFKNAVLIDLADYIQTGEGANGLSYDCISDKEIMVKLYNENYDVSSIVNELEVARKVWELGIPSPRPGELVTDGHRLGIRFRRIAGKRSYARAMSQEPERVPELVREFARYCKQLHSKSCPEGLFPEAKDSFLHLLAASKTLSAEEKAKLEDFIRNKVPECGNAIHGDMHFGNVLTTLPQGASMDEPHEVFFIDLGYFTRGCPLFDLGMTWSICNLSDAAFIEHDMHFGLDTARLAWKVFCQEYFFGPEKLGEKWFGPGADARAVDEGLKLYVVCKLLLVEYNLGFLPEHYARFTKEALAAY